MASASKSFISPTPSKCLFESLESFERRMYNQPWSIRSGDWLPSHYLCGLHSRAIVSSNSCPCLFPSDGSSRISMPGPTDLELRPLGNI